MKRYSLVLEGGGARGAYQVGAIKALKENGYEFDTIVGTSIGALNAAFICQGDIDKLDELWHTLSFQDLMDINNELGESLVNFNLTSEIVNEAAKKAIDAFKAKGIDTKNIRNILEKYIDEEKIRRSEIRFGLVTYCISDMVPQKLFIEDIPKGKLIDYLMATSNLPVFKRQKIDDKKFLDGGAYDNCSVEMLYDAGYKDIVAIRIFRRRNRIRNYAKLSRKKDLNLKIILPSEELPFILNFESNNLKNLVDYGYVDTIKQLKGLDGNIYAIEKISNEKLDDFKKAFTPRLCLKFVKLSNVKYKVGENIVDVALNRALGKISYFLSGKKSKVFKKQIINILEYLANNQNISKNKIYDIEELIKATKEKLYISKIKNRGVDKAAIYLIENLK